MVKLNLTQLPSPWEAGTRQLAPTRWDINRQVTGSLHIHMTDSWQRFDIDLN